MSSNERSEVVKAIERIGPLLFNEDSELDETVELHVNFDVDSDGVVSFANYYVAFPDGDGGWFRNDDGCECPICSLVWYFNAHSAAVEKSEVFPWRWLKISACVVRFFELFVDDMGGVVTDEDNIFTLLIKENKLSTSKIERISIHEFAQDDIAKFRSLIVVGSGDMLDWLGEYHPSGDPIYWFGDKALLVEDVLSAAASDGVELIRVVGVRGGEA